MRDNAAFITQIGGGLAKKEQISLRMQEAHAKVEQAAAETADAAASATNELARLNNEINKYRQHAEQSIQLGNRLRVCWYNANQRR